MPEPQQRFQFIDQFRGFVGILMLIGHSSYYFNSIWKQLDPFDPLFPSWAQFALRYAGYLCAPGFLMMAGAMVWWAYHRRVAKGVPDWTARWHLIQRGIFLIIVQITWVNASWGGFRVLQLWHIGIIASIGISTILLTLIINWRWQFRLLIALLLLIVHPLLLKISYHPDNTLASVLMQTFVDAGKFNKYPVIPWLALAILGSVMATGWLSSWKTDKKRISMGLGIATLAIVLAIVLRLNRAYGNLSIYSDFGSYSFFLDQKYPPSLFMNLWFFAMVVYGVTAFIALGRINSKLLEVFSIPGKVPLIFYAVHLAILGIFVKRLGLFYREGGVMASLIGALLMLIIMLPLSKWFYKVKRRSNNYFIKMI
jgi:uncharacterized membrane protein